MTDVLEEFPILTIEEGFLFYRKDDREILYDLSFFGIDESTTSTGRSRDESSKMRCYINKRPIKLLSLLTLEKINGSLNSQTLYPKFFEILDRPFSSSLSESIKEDYKSFFDRFPDFDGIVGDMNHLLATAYEFILKNPSDYLELKSEIEWDKFERFFRPAECNYEKITIHCPFTKEQMTELSEMENPQIKSVNYEDLRNKMREIEERLECREKEIAKMLEKEDLEEDLSEEELEDLEDLSEEELEELDGDVEIEKYLRNSDCVSFRDDKNFFFQLLCKKISKFK